MRHPVRILVVDGTAAEGQDLADLLRDVGYVTVACSEASDAVRLAATFRPDLVMLERRLPGRLDGPALAGQLHAEGNPLVMFVTGDGSLSDRLAAYDAGADDYVVKPYEVDELLARVRALLRRTGRQESQVSQVGRLVVDEAAHRVAVDGRSVELGATDFAVLAALARHAGHVLSKRHLLELVWGYDAVEENRVEVHISILRRRLGREAAQLIRTVRGVGYVLRDNGRCELQDP
jgi:DNA-binding response OmpR family regulator